MHVSVANNRIMCQPIELQDYRKYFSLLVIYNIIEINSLMTITYKKYFQKVIR